MAKSNPDKHAKHEAHYVGEKSFGKNALFTNNFGPKFHEKKLSESNHSLKNKNELSK